MYIGQAAFESVVQEAQALVVESKQMKDRGVEIVGVHRIFCDTPADLVRGAVNLPAFETATGMAMEKQKG